MPLLQQARLLVLERTLRWKEAFNYATFHGRIAQSLTYAVRAGRHKDIVLLVKQDCATVRSGKVNIKLTFAVCMKGMLSTSIHAVSPG